MNLPFSAPPRQYDPAYLNAALEMIRVAMQDAMITSEPVSSFKMRATNGSVFVVTINAAGAFVISPG